MSKRFEHPRPALVELENFSFFADAATPGWTDEEVGQVLCGFAFDAGMRVSERAIVAARYAPLEEIPFIEA